MCDQVQVTTMLFPYRATLLALKRDRPIHEMRPSRAAPTIPPEGVLQHMRHQEHWRAVGTQVKNFPAVQPRLFGALQCSTNAFRERRTEA